MKKRHFKSGELITSFLTKPEKDLHIWRDGDNKEILCKFEIASVMFVDYIKPDFEFCACILTTIFDDLIVGEVSLDHFKS